jgi:hypothetical protein
VLDVRLRVVQPAAASRLHWVVVEAQHSSLEPSDVTAKLDPATRTIEISTQNVSRLLIDFKELSASTDGRPPVLAAEQPFNLRIDGQREIKDIQWPPGATSVRLLQVSPNDRWGIIGPASPGLKNPQRCGPFKQAFDRELIFLYATGGTPEENAWSWARARYDADRWAYRGNGYAYLMSDDLFLRAQPIWRGKHNVVIYGHADMNKAWTLLEASCPIDVRRGVVRVGGRSLARDDLAVLFTYPRKESGEAAAAVVCGSGMVGQRLTETLPYFTSGAAYPDWTVLSPQMLEQGSAGVLGAGFFGYDWSLDRGDSAWREETEPR